MKMLSQEEMVKQLAAMVRETMPTGDDRRKLCEEAGRALSDLVQTRGLTPEEGACVASFYVYVAIGGEAEHIMCGS